MNFSKEIIYDKLLYLRNVVPVLDGTLIKISAKFK